MAADLPLPAADAARVREVAGEILARPEYREALPSLWDRVLEYIGEALGRLFEALVRSGRGSLVGSVVFVVVVAVVIVALVRLGGRVRRDPGAGVRGRLPRRSAGQWRAEADELERAGRLREALRCSYRGLIAELAEAGLLEEVPGRTTGEYAALVRAALPDAAGPFTTATRAFEAAWYGRAPVEPGDLGRFGDAARAVSDAVGRDRPAQRAPAEVGT